MAAAQTPLSRAFDPRRNGLNGLRLALAVAVIVSHSWPLAGRGEEPHLGHLSLGRFAVGAFFAVSGFLVTGSRLNLDGARYLWHRVLRIFPGYWGALLVTAALAMPLAWWHRHPAGTSLPAGSAAGYVARNLVLHQGQTGIGGTLAQNPFPGAWNGSLWTLQFEFLCYLLVAGFAWLGVLNFRSATAVLIMAATLIIAAEEGLAGTDRLLNHETIADFTSLASYFAAGMMLRLGQDRIPIAWPLAVLSGILGLLAVQTSVPDPLLALPVAYLCLYGSILVPHSPSRDHDLSYGVYVYGFVVQQLLAAFGFARHSLTSFVLASVLLTLPLAAASWYVLERPALRLKNSRLPARQPSKIRVG